MVDVADQSVCVGCCAPILSGEQCEPNRDGMWHSACVGQCIFCQIVAGTATATVVRRWPAAMAIVPIGPVVPGHLLVIPTEHVRDFTSDPSVSAAVMAAAAEIGQPPCNLITSAGAEATQSVFHLHLHVVPRAAGDGLALPWHSGRSRKRP